MHDPVAIPLIETAISVRRLGMTSAPAVFRSHGIRSEQINFALQPIAGSEIGNFLFPGHRQVHIARTKNQKPKTKEPRTKNQEPKNKFQIHNPLLLEFGSWFLDITVLG